MKAVMILVIAVLAARLEAFPDYPQFRYQAVGLSAVLERASIISAGRLTRVRFLGRQSVDLRTFYGLDVHEVYWCDGQFVSEQVIRGKLARQRRFIWATFVPGCKIDQAVKSEAGSSEGGQIWFFREEMTNLRPVVDVLGFYYLTFREPWRKTKEPLKRFGELLLTPEANAATPELFAGPGFFKSASLACDILGESQCVALLRALAARGNPALRNAACRFLATEFSVECNAVP